MSDEALMYKSIELGGYVDFSCGHLNKFDIKLENRKFCYKIIQ